MWISPAKNLPVVKIVFQAGLFLLEDKVSSSYLSPPFFAQRELFYQSTASKLLFHLIKVDAVFIDLVIQTLPGKAQNLMGRANLTLAFL